MKLIQLMTASALFALSACTNLNVPKTTTPIDIQSMWVFSDPALSEQRFRAAMASANNDQQLILQTQIARTYGLRRDFEKARNTLSIIEPQLSSASAEAKTRFQLELGRTFASGRHKTEELTLEAKAIARKHYEKALAIARESKLDDLAIDAIHMFAFIDTAFEDQRKWAVAALAVALESEQPAAKRWEASIRNNLGYALNKLGRLTEAQQHLETALSLRKLNGDRKSVRIAQWMVAWNLRSLNRLDEAIAIQSQLEAEYAKDGQTDSHVFAELAELHMMKGNLAAAERYRALAKKVN